MLESISFNSIAWFAIGTCAVLLFVVCCRKIRKVAAKFSAKNLKKLRYALSLAPNQTLEDARWTLREGGIQYYQGWNAGRDGSHYWLEWSLPKVFWRLELPKEKAKALVTLATYGERQIPTPEYDSILRSARDLASLLAKQAKETPRIVIAITCELSRIAGEKFVNDLLHVLSGGQAA